MISILIPVFNRDVNELVQELSNQVTPLHQEAEIIVMDDGSEPSYRQLHHELNNLPFVRYFDSDQNKGRIGIRQILAGLASFDWLLFLDCDSKIISGQFLENFCKQARDSVHVVVGGRVYTPERPPDCRFRLHWKYGSVREKTTAGIQGYSNRFMTNNFLIRGSIFKKIFFTEEWGGYGYEDTWMGIQLEAMNIHMVYIDNPVKHDGLEGSLEFIAKSREALQNLKRLSRLVTEKVLIKHVRLYLYYYRLRSVGLLWIIKLMYSILESTIRKNLYSCNPSLKMFDLYRLNYFASLRHKL